MLQKIRSLLFSTQPQKRRLIPEGQRVYAIGDIHGRGDLYEALIGAIDADDSQRKSAQTTVILLGDLLDRGADSAGVFQKTRAWKQRRTVRCIAGNHEELLFRSLHEIEIFRKFLQYGGRETILSYPSASPRFQAASLEEAHALLPSIIPQDDLDLIESMEPSIHIGDYFFTHAGVVPGLPLEKQNPKDLRWIRQPFLSDTREHGALIVHGHTIFKEIDIQPNRIGIDTGAYRSGKLSALCLEDDRRWILQTQEDENGISVHNIPLATNKAL